MTVDPTKPPQQRLIIVNTKVGPDIIVHKHSRATAFSILRTFGRRRVHSPGAVGASGGSSTVSSINGAAPVSRPVRSSNGIMLAPRRVQEQYTSTKSTSKLDTHGLLNNSNSNRSQEDGSVASHRSQAEHDRRQPSRDRDADTHSNSSKRKDKDKKSSIRSKSKNRGDEQADLTSSNSTVASTSTTASSKSSTTDTQSSSHETSADDAAQEKQSSRVLPPLPGPPLLPPPPQSAPHTLSHHPSLSTSTAGTLIAANYNNNSSLSPVPSTATTSTFRELHRAASFNQSDLTQRRRLTAAAAARRGPLAESDQEDDLFDDDDDDVLMPHHHQHTRTPHAEAFNTLDADRIGELRARAVNQLRNNAYGGSGGGGGGGGVRFPRNLFPFSPSAAARAARAGRPFGGPGQFMDGMLPTPWLMTAPRSMQEESERQVMGMDSSFRTVGLLPSSPSPASSGGRFRNGNDSRRSNGKQGRSSKGKGRGSGRSDDGKVVNVFESVPEDSLYMLLPMWVGETEIESGEQLVAYEPTQAESQYLLVYYVPFDDKAALKSAREARDASSSSGKKKQKGGSNGVSLTGSGGSLSGNGGGGANGAGGSGRTGDHHVMLTSFRVCARLVGYDELRDSGIRLPSQGLSVKGPLEAALASIPPSSIRDDYQDVVIGVCYSREKGVEFIPEGFDKVGLCLPPTGPLRPGSDGGVDPVYEVSPLGLAAVEMAWAGCMALTSFGPNPGL
jgi:hypothetical protein